MEEIIGILVWIVILVIGVMRKNTSTDKKKKKIENIEKNLKEIFAGDIDLDTLAKTFSRSERENEIAEEDWIPAYEETSVDESVPSAEVVAAYQNITAGKGLYQEEELYQLPVEEERAAKDRIDGEDVFESSDGEPFMDEEDLIKGIIFKEILDRPRALAPYRAVVWR